MIIITLQQKVKVACAMAGISLTELAARMGTSQPNLSKRLRVGRFTKEELEEMATYLGCEYISFFQFKDLIIHTEHEMHKNFFLCFLLLM